MRYFSAILILYLVLLPALGCGAPFEVPDLTSSSSGPAPIFLIDEIESLEVIDGEGNRVDNESARLDTVKIGNIQARALAAHPSGSFAWRGDIPPAAKLTCMIGIGDAPIELFNVFGITPPISRYGPRDSQPPTGVLFMLNANGERIFEMEIPRGESDDWIPVAVDLADYSGENVELVFSTEGIVSGTVLPYWGHPQIAAPGKKPRRVVLLGLDTVAAEHLGWMGYERGTSQSLDILAGQSVIFTDAHSSSPWTLPAFAAVLSGRTPGITGADRRNRGLSMHEDMLAEIFRRNGFATAGFINIPHLQEAGFFQGIDHQWEVHDEPAHNALEQARDWIDLHSDQDFFIFIHLFDPHIPYTPPEKWAEHFRDPDYQGPHRDKWDLQAGLITQNHLDPAVWAGFEESEKRQCEDLYDAEIAGLDETLGEFFNWYDDAGLLDESLVIVFSDHGEEFGEHGRWEHGHSEYEEQLHVPFIIKLPGQSRSRRVEGLVGTIDIYPTLLELFGLTSENESSGMSLVPVLQGGQPDPGRSLIAESTLWGPEIKAIVTNQYKYILTVPTGAEELYDLTSDPEEMENIIAENFEVAEELGGLLEKYVSETQSGWHLRLLAGPSRPLPVDLTISSTAAIERPEIVEQIFNGSGQGITLDGSFRFNVNLELMPGDTVEIRFATSPEISSVTFSGTVGDARSASSGILLGAFEKSLEELAESPPDDDLVLAIDDPVIALGFPEYTREDSRGAYLWSVPENLRAHAASLSPEQIEALESVGYLFD